MFCEVDLLVSTHHISSLSLSLSLSLKKCFSVGKMQIIKRGGGDLITLKESKMTGNNGGETIESLIAGLLLSHIWICICCLKIVVELFKVVWYHGLFFFLTRLCGRA